MRQDTKTIRGRHARTLLFRLGIDPGADYHTLPGENAPSPPEAVALSTQTMRVLMNYPHGGYEKARSFAYFLLQEARKLQP